MLLIQYTGLEELLREEEACLQVLNKLRDFVGEGSCRTSIVLLPSIRDVHHDPVFPQPPFRSALPPSISTLTNPATFRVNEVVIGAATSDTLKQVSLLDATFPAQALRRVDCCGAHLPVPKV